MANAITVTSHVARDFLQNAAYFNTVPKVVWEYVSNSLDNPKDNEPVEVLAEVSRTRVSVRDTGTGMSREDLRRFFQMHGENVARLRGRRVRGRFGTGKCAAFGIANIFRLSSVKGGLRNVVELRRDRIEEARTGEPFPVSDIEVDVQTTQEDGTLVEIEGLFARNPDVDGTIAYVEHHLSRHHQLHTVFINNHLCEYTEPPSIEERSFPAPSDVEAVLGPTHLVIRISPTPLDSDTNGVDILSNGLWHETTLAGLDGREMIRYLFGEVDVAALEDDNSETPPFDNTRSNRLNPQNYRVAVLLGWIAECLESVRKELAEQERERRRSEEAQRLQQEADAIARLLNEDFAAFQHQLARARRSSAGSDLGPMVEAVPQDDSGTVLPDAKGEETSEWHEAGNEHGDGSGAGPGDPGTEPRPGPDLIPGEATGSRYGVGDNGRRRLARGGFLIDYRHESAEAPRSRYERDVRTIVINLDHPQLEAALLAAGGLEGREFRQLCHEIAFVEYAIALPYELAQQFEYYDVEDALYEIRETINRVTRRAATSMS
jgi:hypothetical protein